MKRRGFLAGLVGLFAAPAAKALPFLDEPIVSFVDPSPPLVVFDPGFMEEYRAEFIAGFEAKQTLLRETVRRWDVERRS